MSKVGEVVTTIPDACPSNEFMPTNSTQVVFRVMNTDSAYLLITTWAVNCDFHLIWHCTTVFGNRI